MFKIVKNHLSQARQAVISIICLSYYVVCQVISLLLSIIKRKRIQVMGFNGYELVWANRSPLLILIINYNRYLQRAHESIKILGCANLKLGRTGIVAGIVDKTQKDPG